MTDLDTHLRRALHAAADEIDELTPTELVARLRTAPEPVLSDAPTRRRWVPVAAAILGVVALGAVAVVALDRTAGQDPAVETAAVGPDPSPVGLAQLGPGWHELQGGPQTPTNDSVGLAWTGDDLVVASEGAAHAYSPATDTWRDLELPAELGDQVVEVVWADGRLVAVSRGSEEVPASSAWWDPSTAAWTLLGPVPTAPELAAALPEGAGAIASPSWPRPLTWTGSHVIDLNHGAVLDLQSGTWTAMAFPSNLLEFSVLLEGNPVWTGSELVLLSWSATEGLAWDATGSTYRSIAPPPAAMRVSAYAVTPSLAVPVEGGIDLIATRVGEGGTATTAGRVRWDAASGIWTEVATISGIDPAGGRCKRLGAEVGDLLVIDRCDAGPPVIVGDEGEAVLPVPPFPTSATELCCNDEWLGTDEALVIWRVASDGTGGAEVPPARIAIWVP